MERSMGRGTTWRGVLIFQLIGCPIGAVLLNFFNTLSIFLETRRPEIVRVFVRKYFPFAVELVGIGGSVTSLLVGGFCDQSIGPCVPLIIIAPPKGREL